MCSFLVGVGILCFSSTGKVSRILFSFIWACIFLVVLGTWVVVSGRFKLRLSLIFPRWYSDEHQDSISLNSASLSASSQTRSPNALKLGLSTIQRRILRRTSVTNRRDNIV